MERFVEGLIALLIYMALFVFVGWAFLDEVSDELVFGSWVYASLMVAIIQGRSR